MRKSILLTGLIAVIAVTLAVGLTQTDTGKEWFSVYSKPRATTEESIASAVTPAGTTTATTTPDTTTAAATITTPTATPDTTTASATPTTTPDATTTASATGSMTPANLDAAQAKLNAEAPASGADKTEDVPPAAAPAPSADAAPAAAGTFTPNVELALQDVSIGSKSAPVTVYDFSSLTCPHCGHFHNEILPKIKTDYIDKGKVRWVFKGFPLNEPALKAEMVARCAPKDQYIKLIDLMYQNQDRWAFVAAPLPNLAMLLKLAGITDDVFQGCINDKDLQDALLKKIQADGDKYKLNSTPTFVLNNGEKTINGAGTYEGFAYDLDSLIKYKEKNAVDPKALVPAASTPIPETTPATTPAK